LEPLLKAKARLWWIISSIIVLAVLALATARFPDAWLQVALVAVGWMFFGRSLAEKTVTLVVAPSSSGEPAPAPRGRRLAATLGSFSFASGVISQNWHLAALGVMYATLTSAAMWQNFRERLPCLFDPASERLPAPPTLMHAMVAITAMVDGMGIVSIPIVLTVNVEGIWAAQVVAYGVAALVTWVVMNQFLEGRGVTSRDIWDWPADARSSGAAFATRFPRLASPGVALTVGVGLGVALGVFGLGYRWCLWHVPRIAEDLASMAKYLAEHPDRKWGLLLVAVAFAPIAEEYLFRGLLFRALDREWGGWRAVVGSAIFFGVYHPPLSWIPVGLAGVVLALLFKTSGRLWPCVIVHAVYNAMVIVTL